VQKRVDQIIEDRIQSLDILAQRVNCLRIDRTVSGEGGWIQVGDRALVKQEAATVAWRSFNELLELISPPPAGQFAPKPPEIRFRLLPLLCG